MSKYLIPLIKKRLAELERRKAIYESIITDNNVEIFSGRIREFNVFKSGMKKIQLKQIISYRQKRSDLASRMKSNIELEIDELKHQLAIFIICFDPPKLKSRKNG